MFIMVIFNIDNLHGIKNYDVNNITKFKSYAFENKALIYINPFIPILLSVQR